MPAEQIAAMREARAGDVDDEAFALWAWHRDALRLFDALRTQWRTAVGLGGLVYVGLDYGVLDGVMRRIGLGEQLHDEELFGQLQVMERAGRDQLNGVTTGDG